MNTRPHLPGILISCSILLFGSCGEKPKPEATHFTKADSLTDTYLNLKDSMLQAWNEMINDDNQKLKAMFHLLHELEVSNPQKRDEFKSFEERLIQLAHSRYTQKSMENTHIIEEYDFASNSLVSELISLAESQTQFGYNTTIQKLVEKIRLAEQRVENYRLEYDSITTAYNQFIDENKNLLIEVDQDSFLEKKPLFQTVSEE